MAFDGVNQKGREAIVNAHRPLFEKWLKGSRLTGEIVTLRFLAPDGALLHASGGTVLSGKTTPEPERASVQSLVAVEREGVWRWASFHNTRVRPLSGGRGLVLWNITDKLWRRFAPKGRRLEPPVHGTHRRAAV